MNIVCVEPLGLTKEYFETLKAQYTTMGHRFAYYIDRREDEATLIKRMAEADIAVVSNIKLSATVLAACPQLRYLSIAFTGLDHIDLEYCHNHGIEVQNAAGYSTTAVSELAIGMMLDLLRGITTMDGIIRQGKARGQFLGRELRGKCVGIVGTGAIGCATAKLALSFGATVIAYSRSEKAALKDMGVVYASLEEVLQKADIVSLHTPLTPDTRHLIGSHELSMMKPTALLVNTARGPVADIEAVASALQAGTLAGAAFDVFENEPPLPTEHPLLSAPNALLTPHIAFATEESFAARGGIVFDHVNWWLNQQGA